MPIILSFWEGNLPELDVPTLSPLLVLNLNKEKMSEKEEEARWKLKFILSVVRVTRIAMNLGYLTTDNIELIVG